MGTQKQALLILSIFVISACSKSTASSSHETSKEAQDFRKYATAICLGSSFGEASVKADANRSANVYLGNVDLQAYESLRSQLQSWRPDGFATKNGPQAAIARCMEFSESDAVNQVFRRFDPCKNQDVWLDQKDFKTQCN
ncbi:hypothetical protein [Microbulbifer hydrolyticus]|uniref:Lipoprotein n=1 Tax=Microbulbifer hydrolyticus TaxID=48074 RepID=A0A6P1TDE5_9GAMM|nr:hypothetical protein [Microbulbifer hydrolyticus]MBB5212391.1 hypothetical protein [Microbulbifer hydrolyticus]QHQ40027.1 hypothetical protein GTQ55_14245 [Microbulbifer hydrolyticus]